MHSEEDSSEADQEDQTMLTFDLPISSKPLISDSEEVEVFTLEETVRNMLSKRY